MPSYMDDGDGSPNTGNTSTTAGGDSPEPAVPADEKDDSSSTGLLPKEFFEGADKKPGDKCEVEVVHVYDDQVEVKYVKHDGNDSPKDSSEPMGDDSMVRPPSGMTAMDE